MFRSDGHGFLLAGEQLNCTSSDLFRPALDCLIWSVNSLDVVWSCLLWRPFAPVELSSDFVFVSFVHSEQTHLLDTRSPSQLLNASHTTLSTASTKLLKTDISFASIVKLTFTFYYLWSASMFPTNLKPNLKVYFFVQTTSVWISVVCIKVIACGFCPTVTGTKWSLKHLEDLPTCPSLSSTSYAHLISLLRLLSCPSLRSSAVTIFPIMMQLHFFRYKSSTSTKKAYKCSLT